MTNTYRRFPPKNEFSIQFSNAKDKLKVKNSEQFGKQIEEQKNGIMYDEKPWAIADWKAWSLTF